MAVGRVEETTFAVGEERGECTNNKCKQWQPPGGSRPQVAEEPVCGQLPELARWRRLGRHG